MILNPKLDASLTSKLGNKKGIFPVNKAMEFKQF